MENIKCIQLEKYHKGTDDEKREIECNPYVIFHQAIENCKPLMVLSKVVRGGISYQVRPSYFTRSLFLFWHHTHTCVLNKEERNVYLRKEGNVLFNDILNTFYLRLYGVRHMVEDHTNSERGNPLPPHGLLFPICNKGSFICIIPQTR